MIMVNNNGGPGLQWHFMNHAVNAERPRLPTDLVFTPPSRFVIGVSVVFAFLKRDSHEEPHARSLHRHTIVRAAILIALGIITNSFPFFHLPTTCGSTVSCGKAPRCPATSWSACSTSMTIAAWTKWVALIAALVGYWGVLVRCWVPIPGAGVPARDVPFMDMTQNLVSWIDRHLLPLSPVSLPRPDHNVRDPERPTRLTSRDRHMPHGSLAGIWLRSKRTIPAKTAGLAVACIASLASCHKVPAVSRVSAE